MIFIFISSNAHKFMLFIALSIPQRLSFCWVLFLFQNELLFSEESRES